MTFRITLIGIFLLACSSENTLTGSMGQASFATSTQLGTDLVGGYWKLFSDGSSETWRFSSDGRFERQVFTRLPSGGGQTTGKTSTWTIQDGGVVRIQDFEFSDAASGPAWFKVMLTPALASFVSTGDSKVQVTFGDFERTP